MPCTVHYSRGCSWPTQGANNRTTLATTIVGGWGWGGYRSYEKHASLSPHDLSTGRDLLGFAFITSRKSNLCTLLITYNTYLLTPWSRVLLEKLTGSIDQETDPTKSVFFQPAHISATNIEWLLPEAVLIQFIPPDDEHDVLERCREI